MVIGEEYGRKKNCSVIKKGAMGRKRKTETDEAEEKKRKLQVKWTQLDTERLCELILEFGREGILNKTTNAATNEKRKSEWELITFRFNSHPSNNNVRDTDALIARYRRILFEMRVYTKWQRDNFTATGGGQPQPKPKELKIEATAPILALSRRFEHLLTGLPPCDSNRPDDRSSVRRSGTVTSGAFAAMIGESSSTLVSESSAGATETQPTAIEIKLEIFDPDISDENTSDEIFPSSLNGINSMTPRKDPLAPDRTPHRLQIAPGRTSAPKRFFSTSDQRRRNLKSNNNNDEIDYWAKRLKLVEEERMRATESHRMRVEAHEQRMRHREAIFQKQIIYWDAVIKSKQRKPNAKIINNERSQTESKQDDSNQSVLRQANDSGSSSQSNI